MSIAFCTPLSLTCPTRIRNWELCSKHMEDIVKDSRVEKWVVAESVSNVAHEEHFQRVQGDRFSISRNRNQAASVCNSDFLCFLDTDFMLSLEDWDFILDDCQNYDCYSPFKSFLFLTKNQTTNRITNGKFDFSKPHPVTRFRRTKWNWMCAGIVILSRKLFEESGGWDERFKFWGSEDSAMSMLAIQGGYKTHFANKKAVHLWHKVNRTGNQDTRQIQKIFYDNTTFNEKVAGRAPMRTDNFYKLGKCDDVPVESKKKNCIVTMQIGDHGDAIAKKTLERIQKYADKCDADLVIISDDKWPDYVQGNKFRVQNICANYERILYIDLDIWIKPDAESLFNLPPGSVYINAESEMYRPGAENTSTMISLTQEVPRRDVMSLNTGVVLLDNKDLDIFEPPRKDLPDSFTVEQVWVEYNILTKKKDVLRLPKGYNCLFNSPNFEETYTDSKFIHYNGLPLKSKLGHFEWQLKNEHHRHYQIEGHGNIPFYKYLASFLTDGIFVELGCFKGQGTSVLAGECLRRGVTATIHTIDTFEGSPDQPIIVSAARFENLFDRATKNLEYYKNVKIIKSDSIEAATMYENESLEGVFLDSNHTYEHVSKEIAAWSPKVKPGGIISGHDFYNEWPGVIQAVTEAFPRRQLFQECWYVFKDK